MMQKETLKFISDVLTDAGIPYDFMEFNSDISSLNQYWVGEYQENEPITEDGLQGCTFILTGTAKDSYVLLESTKQTIEELFPSIEGQTAILDNGTGVAIFYASALHIPTGDETLKRIQINLNVKEWKVK